MKTNELIIIDVDKSLKIKRNEIVFPLTATHRKELREFKNRNIGNLKSQINTIRKMKLTEYKEKYWKELKIIIDDKKEKIEELNKDFEKRILLIRNIINQRIEIENENSELIKLCYIDYTYDIADLENVKKDIKRVLSIEDSKIASLLEEEFKNKYNESFIIVQKKIDKLEELYEEAINFGCLEQVKRIYYVLKDTEQFVNNINNLKI